MPNSINRDAALALVSQHLRIFPCNSDKTPTVRAWEDNATDNTFTIEAKWQGSPHLLPAIPVGAQGMVVIDCDVKDGKNGVAAFHSFCAAHHIDLSSAFVVETPSTGLHFYFRTETHFGNSSGSLPAGIDVRGLGGYVIGPGATLPGGRSYRIIAGTWNTIPALPDALAALLREKQSVVSSVPLDSATGLPLASDASLVTVTDRNREYAAKALADESSIVAAMIPGMGRNNQLNTSAHSMGTLAGNGSIEAQTVAVALIDAATRNGHVAKHGISQTIATINSGLNAGILKPRPLLKSSDPSIDVSGLIANNIAASKATLKTKHDNTSNGSNMKSVILISRGTDIQARPIDWLWPEYLPKGMLTILAGEGGAGKSTIAFSLAATITTGGFWPDGMRCNGPGNVLIFSTEDEPETVIQPRLMAARANPNHYGIIRGTLDEKGRKRAFDANRDIALLRESIEQIGSVSLLIIDPIVTLVKGDINQSNVVRQSLEAVIELASEYKCSVVGITHFAKNSKGKSLVDRVLSSRAFTDLARMVWAVVQNRETSERAFGRIKTNIARESDAFPYSIEEVWITDQIRTTRIIWGNKVEGSSHLLLGGIEGTPENDNSGKASHVKQFLLSYLSNGPKPADEVLVAAIEQLNVCKNTVTTAKRDLNIASKKNGMGGWNWQLPFTEQLKAAKGSL